MHDQHPSWLSVDVGFLYQNGQIQPMNLPVLLVETSSFGKIPGVYHGLWYNPQTQIVEIYEPFIPKCGEFCRFHRLTYTIHYHPLPSITILYLSFDVHIFTVQITISFPGHDPVLAGAVHVIRQTLQGVGGGFLVVGIHLSSWIEAQIKDIIYIYPWIIGILNIFLSI